MPHTTLRELFDSLVELEAQARESRLASLSLLPADRARLMGWLEADTHAGEIFPESAESLIQRIASSDDPAQRWVGQHIGPFRIVEHIGDGGSSIVFRAERPVGTTVQTVALKLLYAGFLSAGNRRRTLREQSILAQLQHPNIARLVDAGITADGLPYLATEFVSGKPINLWANDARLGLKQRIQLVMQLCGPIDAAHTMLVVHCDLKPSNLLVDDAGVVKVLDFGVARLLRDGADAEATRTCAFTPEYAAPEQFRPGPTTVAVDVYALGVVLGELLCGQRRSAANEPPSQRAASSALSPPPGLPAAATLAGLLRGDLDAIVTKATATDPAERYRSAAELRADLQRYLDGHTVIARRWTRRYSMSKFLTRHRWSVAGAAVFALSISATALLAMRQAALARAYADDAKAQAQRADHMRTAVLEVFSEADPNRPRDHEVTVLEAVERGVESLLAQTDREPRSRFELLEQFADTLGKHGRLDRAVRVLEQAHAESAATLGPAHPVTLSVGETYAFYLGYVGQYVKSRAVSGELLTLGANAPDALRVRLLRRSAVAAWRTKDKPAALQAGLAAMTLSRALGDEELLRSTLSDYAVVLLGVGEIEAAAVAFEELLAINEARFGPQHERVALASAALSRAYRRLQKPELAERHARRAVEIVRAIHDGDHWVVGNHLNALSRVQSMQRDFEGALATDLEVLRIYRNTLPADHPDVRAGHANVGAALIKLERYDEAAVHLEDAVTMQVESSPAALAATAHYRCQWGVALAGRGDAAAGRREVERAQREFASLVPPSPGQQASCIDHRIRLELDAKAYADAESALAALGRAIESIEAPERDVWALRATFYQGELALRTERLEDARVHLRQAVSLSERSAHRDAELYAESQLLLALAESKSGLPERALETYTAARRALDAVAYPPARLKALHDESRPAAARPSRR